MTLKLTHHPIASFCHTVSTALHEEGADFEPVTVGLGDCGAPRFPCLNDLPMPVTPGIPSLERVCA